MSLNLRTSTSVHVSVAPIEHIDKNAIEIIIIDKIMAIAYFIKLISVTLYIKFILTTIVICFFSFIKNNCYIGGNSDKIR